MLPQGRSTPERSGLWLDSHVEPWKRVMDFAHSQGQEIVIQFGHAGRKASTVAPWLAASEMAIEKNGVWPTKLQGPSPIAYSDRSPTPNEMTKNDLETLKYAYGAATKRAIKADFDAVEIHGAHGYLMHTFYSPVSNKRMDEYGGSFKNRICLLTEVTDLIRKELPDNKSLFVRINGTDWLDYEGSPIPGSWTLDDSIKLAHTKNVEPVIDCDRMMGVFVHPVSSLEISSSSVAIISGKAEARDTSDCHLERCRKIHMPAWES